MSPKTDTLPASELIELLFFAYRGVVFKLFGVENHPLLTADCRDWLTCFSMSRFKILNWCACLPGATSGFVALGSTSAISTSTLLFRV